MNRKNNHQNENNITIIYIGGFLVPRHRMPFDETLQVPTHMKIICVYPSGVSSLHDRVMQLFYELKGGRVHYGEEHSKFHGHDHLGVHFEQGSYPEWDENHPIHVIGHSFGGLTARVLQYYLSLGNMFHGHKTSDKWIISISTVNTPLNGALRTYSYGAHQHAPPLVRLASLGYWIGISAHIFEYLDQGWVRSIYDFQLSYWQLSWTLPGSFRKLLLALSGCAIHSTTDNSAYDMTVHSQKYWSKFLSTTHSSTYYLSIVGTSYTHLRDWKSYFVYFMSELFFRQLPVIVAGVDTSGWTVDGFDGLLTAQTQTVPFLKHFTTTTAISTTTSTNTSSHHNNSNSSNHKQHNSGSHFNNTTNSNHISNSIRRNSMYGVPYIQITGDNIVNHNNNNTNMNMNSSDENKSTRRRKSIKSQTTTTTTTATHKNSSSNTDNNSSSFEEVHAGIHYVKQFSIHHLDNPSEERNHAWRFILSTIQQFHTHSLTLTNHHSNTSPSPNPFNQVNAIRRSSCSGSVNRRLIRSQNDNIDIDTIQSPSSSYNNNNNIYDNTYDNYNYYSSVNPPDRQIPIQLQMSIIPHSVLLLHSIYLFLLPISASITILYLLSSYVTTTITTTTNTFTEIPSLNITYILLNIYNHILVFISSIIIYIANIIGGNTVIITNDQWIQSGSISVMVFHIFAFIITVWTLIRISNRAHRHRHNYHHHHIKEEPVIQQQEQQRYNNDKDNFNPFSVRNTTNTSSAIKTHNNSNIFIQKLRQMDILECLGSIIRISIIFNLFSRYMYATVTVVHVIIVWLLEITKTANFNEYRLHPMYLSLLALFYVMYTQNSYDSLVLSSISNLTYFIDIMTVISCISDLIVSWTIATTSNPIHMNIKDNNNNVDNDGGNDIFIQASGVRTRSRSVSLKSKTDDNNSHSYSHNTTIATTAATTTINNTSTVKVHSLTFDWLIVILLSLALKICSVCAMYFAFKLMYASLFLFYTYSYYYSYITDISGKMISVNIIILLFLVPAIIQIWRKIRLDSECLQKLYIYDKYRYK